MFPAGRYDRLGMDIQSQKTSVSCYRIERKPEGGYVARSADPAMPPIEAPTQAELSQKIQAAAVSSALASLKLLTNLAESGPEASIDKVAMQNIVITTKSGGTHTATPEEIKKFAGLLGKNFPELSQAMAERIARAKVASDADPPRLSGDADLGSNAPVINAPIIPERGISKIFGILTALLALASLVYFFFLHR
jgi:hypothetical protein